MDTPFKSFPHKIRFRPRASALLVALLLMGFLAVFGIGMSRLVVNAIRVERNVVEAGKAYYAAEAAVERALWAHENFLPGYEVSESDSVFTLSNGAQAMYGMVALEESVPCAHRGEWRELALQESLSLPLFHYTPAGHLNVSEFSVKVRLQRNDFLSVKGPMVRWKILGLDPNNGRTQAISGLLETNTVLGGESVLTETNSANFYDGASGGTFANYPEYPISQFLENHTLSTLTLVNVIVPSEQGVGFQSPEQNRIRVKVSSPKELACEVALIRATGLSGQTRQDVDAQVALDSFLPVFDFVLYQTPKTTAP